MFISIVKNLLQMDKIIYPTPTSHRWIFFLQKGLYQAFKSNKIKIYKSTFIVDNI